MTYRPLPPITRKFLGELFRPHGPRALPPLGEPAPDFELPYARYLGDMNGQENVEDGKTLRLSTFRGRPVVLHLTRIVNEWFVCPNCAPHLQELRVTAGAFEQRGVGVVIVSSTDKAMTRLVALALRLPYPIVSDPEWVVFERYGMGSEFGLPLPGTFLIDAAGIIRWHWAAPLSPFFTPPKSDMLLPLLDELGTRDNPSYPAG